MKAGSIQLQFAATKPWWRTPRPEPYPPRSWRYQVQRPRRSDGSRHPLSVAADLRSSLHYSSPFPSASTPSLASVTGPIRPDRMCCPANHGRRLHCRRSGPPSSPGPVPPAGSGDPAIMDLDRAKALIYLNEFDAGANLIATTLARLPVDHRTGIFLTLAARALDAVPAQARRRPASRECAGLLDTLSIS